MTLAFTGWFPTLIGKLAIQILGITNQLQEFVQQQIPEKALKLTELLSALLQAGLITVEQRESLLFAMSQTPSDASHPITLISTQGWKKATDPNVLLDAEELTRWLADRANLPYIRIDPLKIDVNAVTNVMSYAYAERFKILPISVDGSQITIATCEPYIREWEHELTDLLKLKFERVIVNPASLERYLPEFYAVSRSISDATSRSSSVSSIGNLEQLVELGRTGEVDADDQHIVRIVDWLLQYAFDQGASDIHLEPRREKGNIRFRIDGILHLVHQISNPILAAVISRTKAIGRMDVVERRRPQDGRLKTKTPTEKEIELRLSTMPTTFGEKLVMRIFDPDVLVRSFSELGLTHRDEQRWRHMVTQPHGIIVVTGPTGSGKTTTLYSALKHLAKPEINICTIEDPIELVDPHFNQMNVQHNIDLTFASGVRTLLRQDPDIIMIGEIRDRETADTAIQAALTGHLVLTTLHTSDAPSSITRLLDLGVPPYLIKASLIGVLAQRLVRRLCEKCKTKLAMSPDEWAALVTPMRARTPAEAFGAVGCDDCRHTGYRGRIGIFELMNMDDTLRAEVTPSTNGAKLRHLALKQGMHPLRISGAEKILTGVTTLSEVVSVVSGDEE